MLSSRVSLQQATESMRAGSLQPRRAIILGAQSPLGVYLCRALQASGTEVHIASHEVPDSAVADWEAAGVLPHHRADGCTEHSIDMESRDLVSKLISQVRPHEMYWLSTPPEILHVATKAHGWAASHIRKASAILDGFRDYCLDADNTARLVHTVQAWPAGQGSAPRWSGFPQRRTVASLTSSAQSLVRSVCKGYRLQYGMWIANVALALHESPIDSQFGTLRKIVRASVRAQAGLPVSLCLGDPDETGDWGFTGDHASAIQAIARLQDPEDFYVSAGNVCSVREILEKVFQRYGLQWRQFCEIDPARSLPAWPNDHEDSASRMREVTGWQPVSTFDELLEMLIQSEQVETSVELLTHHGMTTKHGMARDCQTTEAGSGEFTTLQWLAAALGHSTAAGSAASGSASGWAPSKCVSDTPDRTGEQPRVASKDCR